MRRLLLALALCAAVSGCGRKVFVGSSGPPTASPIYALSPNIATSIESGAPGYGISASTGGSYRLVWVGNGARTSRFYGSVFTLGNFDSFSPGCSGFCPLEGDDYVSQPLQATGALRIDFDTTTASGFDGIDFVVSAEPVYFDLYIDGARYPNLVFFPSAAQGGQIAIAGAVPFGLTTQP